jgi:peptidoglycan/LPS O-acetylase OafA/YrhL
MNQGGAGLPNPHWGAFFYRGAPAVAFFFTMSGFLITYLLLKERERTGGIDVGRFYLRRACRIWPLYFAIVVFGLTFYNAVLPRVGIAYPVDYDLGLAVLLYTFFLPNVMNGLYRVGGILNPLWSIGVEEQFYLVWGPVMRRIRGALPYLCLVLMALSFALFCVNHEAFFGHGAPQMILGQLRIHFMAAGALCAWAFHTHRERLLSLPVFASRAFQVVLFALVVEYYLVGQIPWGWVLEEAVQAVLYPWLILTVAANPRNVIRVSNPVFEWLGTISYGLYMWHMVAVYGTSGLFRATDWWRGNLWLYLPAYYAVALTATFLLAWASYRWLELPFLRLKDRRYAVAPVVAPGAAARAA